MEQRYSSKETSINTVNTVYRKTNFKNNSIILDYGAGKYNSNKEFIENQNKGIIFLKYDKYNCSSIENNNSINYCKNNIPNYIICSNVLNVILEDDIIEQILQDIKNLANKDTEIIIGIYEGNKTGIGTTSTKGYQRNQRATIYTQILEQYFSLKRKGNIFYCKIK